MGRHETRKIDGFLLMGPHDDANPNSREMLHALDHVLNESKEHWDVEDIPDEVMNLGRAIGGFKKANKVTACFADLVVAAPPMAVGWYETEAPKGGIQALKKALERAGYRIGSRCTEFETYG